MNVFALAVLLTIMQASPPVPRKTADPRNGTPQNVTEQASGDQSPAKQAPPLVQPISPQPNQDTRHSPAAENTQKPVIIRELPPVSVTKDWLDKTYIALTVVLIAVGGLGVRAAYRTLRILRVQTAAIRRQGLSMRRQTTHLRRSVIFARRSANAAKKSADALMNAERAWVVAKVDAAGTLSLINLGRTPAEITAVRETGEVLPLGEELPVPPEYDGGLPTKLRQVRMLAPKEDWKVEHLLLWSSFLPEQVASIYAGTSLYYHFGQIEYMTIFARPEIHETRFCFRYNRHTKEFEISGPPEYTNYT